MDATSIQSIPKCLTELANLERVSFAGCSFLGTFPIELFDSDHSPKLEEISAIQTNGLTFDALITSNDFTTFKDHDVAFNYNSNQNASYWFENAGF